jgi:hypothetical protein
MGSPGFKVFHQFTITIAIRRSTYYRRHNLGHNIEQCRELFIDEEMNNPAYAALTVNVVVFLHFNMKGMITRMQRTSQ